MVLVPEPWYPPQNAAPGVGVGVNPGYYDYNNYYYGPCGEEPPLVWDDGCGGDGTIPYCDEQTCANSCYQFMGYDYGMCINNECFCRKSRPDPPGPKEDWNYGNQNGNPMTMSELDLYQSLFFNRLA